MAGKGGGAWKVAYADFVTAMMAFFMVMWLIAQNEKVKNAVAKHFRNPNVAYAMGNSPLPPRHPQTFKDHRPTIAKGHAPQPPEDETHTSRKPYTITLYHGDHALLGTAIYFKEETTELTELARTRLLGFVPLAQGKPQKVEIRGHAARPIRGQPPSPDPWELSYQRCLHTMRFLAENGIPLERIRLSQAGASEPYTIGDLPERMARNSRVEVFLLDEIAEDAVGTWEERELRYQTPGKVTPAPNAPSASSPSAGGNTYPVPAAADAGTSH